MAVKLLQVNEEHFTVKRSRELMTVFAASQAENTAFKRQPHSELCMNLQVADMTQTTVHLRYSNFYSLGKEKRRDIRVRNDKPIKVILKNTAAQPLECRAMECRAIDFSISGLGLFFTHKATFQIGDICFFL